MTFKDLKNKVSVGDNIALSFARCWQYGYWQDFEAFGDYAILQITEKEIICENKLHPRELASITNKNIRSGRLKFNYQKQ